MVAVENGKNKTVQRPPITAFFKQALEDAAYWLRAQPTPVNHLDASNVERFYETGSELIEAVVGAIACGQHVALAGPRGCGKSYCIGRAIQLAEARGLLPKGGWIKIQGNKELPRDYLIEDDVALKVRGGLVTPELKSAPLFGSAFRDINGRPMIGDDGLVEIRGRLLDGSLTDEVMRPDQKLVLFLDEANRFSDGVLDSLLLLLEEGEAIMAGNSYRMRIVVLMTMNPPGYDASARNLSPPLSARIGRQYRLLSPQINVLTDTVAPEVIRKLIPEAPPAKPVPEAEEPDAPLADAPATTTLAPEAIAALAAEASIPTKLEPDEQELVSGDRLRPGEQPTLQNAEAWVLRRAAAATLCCWGDPRTEKPGFEYLSPEMRRLLINLADSDKALGAAMSTLNGLCHFGPDARALIDWLKAASVAATNEARSLWAKEAQIRARHFTETAITVLSHKVQDSFSSASRPDNTRRKEEAINVIARTLLQGSLAIDKLLYRKLDDVRILEPAATVVLGARKAKILHQALVKAGASEDEVVQSWCDFIQLCQDATGTNDKLETDLVKEMIRLKIIEPVTHQERAFCSESHQTMAKWLVEQGWPGLKKAQRDRLRTVLTRIANQPAYSVTFGKYLDRLRCIQDKVWSSGEELRKLIAERAGDLAMERTNLRTIADCIDLFWVRAEHYGVEVVPTIEQRLTDLHLHPGTRNNVNGLIRYAAEVMAAKNSRGKNTRLAMRALPPKKTPPAQQG